jgi:hypothetical protein
MLRITVETDQRLTKPMKCWKLELNNNITKQMI